jgi:hypothetical protein
MGNAGSIAVTEVKLSEEKRACLIYVTATEGNRDSVRARLEQGGYRVCEVKAELDDALAAKEGSRDLPVALTECITTSHVCVFLLPEETMNDGMIGDAADLANRLEKRIIGVIAGARVVYPESLDDHAHSMVRENSGRLDDAICGTEVWERPNRLPVADRPIEHVRCQ